VADERVEDVLRLGRRHDLPDWRHGTDYSEGKQDFFHMNL
jgi:hypothetical protein